MPDIVRTAILITLTHDTFAFAANFDDVTKRYRSLRGVKVVELAELAGLLVKPDAARRKLEDENVRPATEGKRAEDHAVPPRGGPSPEPPATRQLTRFHGTVELDATRVSRDAGRVADEVNSHLSGLIGATVTVALETQADVPSGAPYNVVRTVTENCLTLEFTTQGLEEK